MLGRKEVIIMMQMLFLMERVSAKLHIILYGHAFVCFVCLQNVLLPQMP